MLRTLGWIQVTGGLEVEGVTILHPVHQFTLEYLNAGLKPVRLHKRRPGSDKQKKRHTELGDDEYLIFNSASPLVPETLSTKGPYAAYVGSTTTEKKSGSIYQIPYAGRPLQAAQRLLQLNDWTVTPHSSFAKYIEDMAVSRTNVPIELLKTATDQIIGGSVVHRLDDHVTKRGTLKTDSLCQFAFA
jgi:hypothetical protein